MSSVHPIAITRPSPSTPDISPLSLCESSPSSSPSELSLDDRDQDDDVVSLADTSDSCCSTCCSPPPSSSPPKTQTVSLPEEAFQPLIIIGAGPHALALAARLSESRPAALYTDLEHARLSWLQREQSAAASSGRKQKDRRKTVKGHWTARKLVQPTNPTVVPAPRARTIRVLDNTSPHWLGRWDGFFQGLHISHLRSPMLFHPAPADADALVAFARRTAREGELEPIEGVVGKEFSKYQRKKCPKRTGRAATINERSREDYFRPSTPLFHSFVASDLIDRYDLAPLVTHTTVTSLSYGPVHVHGQEPTQGFVVKSTNPDGTTSISGAKAVVMAIGPSNRPIIPPVIRDALPLRPRSPSGGSSSEPWDASEICGEGWCHSSAFALPGFDPLQGSLGAKIVRGEPTRAVVIGGGLTSAQIVDSLLNAGVSHVTLLTRSHLKTSHFDFPLSWVSKYANLSKAAFWAEESREERLRIIKEERNGGSVNPVFAGVLRRWAAEGRAEVRSLTEVRTAQWDEERRQWALEVETTPKKIKGDPDVGAGRSTRQRLENVDYLVCSTGSKLDLDSVDFLRPLRESHPVETVSGLPALTTDLQWNPELPFFVMGAYSMLELGPDALNLAGTRTGAERIAHRLGALGVFDEQELEGEVEQKASKRWEEKESRSGGKDNYFAGLEEALA
ncbi:hypothetical protein JCM5296_006674 [Sporobolomyces johnsonii]